MTKDFYTLVTEVEEAKENLDKEYEKFNIAFDKALLSSKAVAKKLNDLVKKYELD